MHTAFTIYLYATGYIATAGIFLDAYTLRSRAAYGLVLLLALLWPLVWTFAVLSAIWDMVRK